MIKVKVPHKIAQEFATKCTNPKLFKGDTGTIIFADSGSWDDLINLRPTSYFWFEMTKKGWNVSVRSAKESHACGDKTDCIPDVIHLSYLLEQEIKFHEFNCQS